MGMILARAEGAPVGEDTVTDEFIDDPLVLEDYLRHGCEIFIEQRDQFHRWRAFGESREIAHVTEEDRQLALLPGKIHVVDVFEYVIHELRSNVAVERAASAP